MRKDYSELCISSVVAIEHTATLFYSWSIRYIVNRAPGTIVNYYSQLTICLLREKYWGASTALAMAKFPVFKHFI